MLGKLKPLVAGRSRNPLVSFLVSSRPLQGTGRVHPVPCNEVCCLLTALVLYVLALGAESSGPVRHRMSQKAILYSVSKTGPLFRVPSSLIIIFLKTLPRRRCQP